MERIEKLKQFLVQNPGDSFLKHALALEYIKSGMDENARELFEEVVSRDPGYTGTYYHLGKLLEKSGLNSQAREIYEKGMSECKKAGDPHSFNELQNALEDLD